MASKTILVDDIDGSEKNIETVRITYEGTQYVLDLGPRSRKALTDALTPFLSKGRIKAQSGESRSARIRHWAEEEGITVPARGRIPTAVEQAYDARDGHDAEDDA